MLIYQTTEYFPKSELYGLTLQIRKCAVSISSNVAEGQRRGHKAECIQFARIAFGSGAELETQLLIAYRVGFLSEVVYKDVSNKLDEVMKMLNSLISKLK